MILGEQYSHLTINQRYQLEALLRAGTSVRKIAEILGVHRSTIYREKNRATYIHRNSDWTEEKRYAPETSQECYQEHLKEKGRELKIGSDVKYAKFIERMIVDEKYSPAAALMKAEEKDFKTKICVTTLYTYINRGIFLKLTNKNLPVKKNEKRQYKRIRVQKRTSAGTSIEKRPEEINTREEFGHWEMDTVVGKQGVSKKSFLVLTERKTREEIVYLLKNHTAKQVVIALNRIEKQIGTENFRKIFKTITVDNGTEFADFKGMENARRSNKKRTTIYYCHPYSSGERGSNENNNKLVRRQVPKGIVFDDMTKTEVREMQDWINSYPRKLLKKKCSAELFEKELESLNSDDTNKKQKLLKQFFLPRASPIEVQE